MAGLRVVNGRGYWQTALYDEVHVGVNGWVLLVATAICSMGLGWSALSLQKQISATSMIVVNNANKFVVILYGMIFLGESTRAPVVAGCCVAIIGSLLYGVASHRVKAETKHGGDSTSTSMEPTAKPGFASACVGCLDTAC